MRFTQASRTALATLATVTAAMGSDAAHAESSIKLSGMIDMGVFRDSTSTWNVGTIQRSNVALSGEEDLGDGWAATFRLSHRFDADTGMQEDKGNKPFWYDESTVGLKGPVGTLRLGRALDAIYSQDWQFDPWGNFDRVASPAWDLWHTLYPSDPHGNLNGRADYGRLSHGVFYDSPTVGGFALHVSASPQTEAGDVNKPAAASLTYSVDGVMAIASHAKNSAGATDTFLGLRGDVAGVTLMAAHDRSEAGADVARATTFGAQYTLGLTRFNLGWGTLRVNGTEQQRTLAAGAVYSLSKRTALYVDLARKRYVADAATVYGMGVMHSF